MIIFFNFVENKHETGVYLILTLARNFQICHFNILLVCVLWLFLSLTFDTSCRDSFCSLYQALWVIHTCAEWTASPGGTMWYFLFLFLPSAFLCLCLRCFVCLTFLKQREDKALKHFTRNTRNKCIPDWSSSNTTASLNNRIFVTLNIRSVSQHLLFTVENQCQTWFADLKKVVLKSLHMYESVKE